MKNILNHKIAYQRYFEEMCRIPHGSYHEQAYGRYLLAFAKDHGLKNIMDEWGNVVIYKPASKGYEDHEPVILQAHMDMVCAKSPDSDHDFENEPLDLYIENGWLKARDTTLGADDGAGVAYILAILEDDTLAHPPLECVLTVQEEVGNNGARNLKAEYFSAKRMIGLDDGGGVTSFVSAAGIVINSLEMPIERKTEAVNCRQLIIGGLKGGHSGTSIHKEHGNAISIAVRIIYPLVKDKLISFVSIEGGSAHNVIPDSCKVTFSSSLDDHEIDKKIDQLAMPIKDELKDSDKDLKIEVVTAGLAAALSDGSAVKLLEFLFLLPNGLRHSSMSIPGLATASANIGKITTDKDKAVIEWSARGATDSLTAELATEQEILASKYGVKITLLGECPAWEFDRDSKIRRELFNVYHELLHHEIKPIAVHGGLECSFLSKLICGLDIVCIGPETHDMHMITESLELKSFDDIYRVVIETLKRL